MSVCIVGRVAWRGAGGDTFKSCTPSPSSTTSPAASWPITMGAFNVARLPTLPCTQIERLSLDLQAAAHSDT